MAPTPDTDAYTRIARVVHEATRAWQQGIGEEPAPTWDDAPQWMRDSSREAVVWRLQNPNAPPSAQHDQWMAEKKATGWVLGKVKDPAKKTHPMMVPYDDLPEKERRKDALVGSIIDALGKTIR